MDLIIIARLNAKKLKLQSSLENRKAKLLEEAKKLKDQYTGQTDEYYNALSLARDSLIDELTDFSKELDRELEI